MRYKLRSWGPLVSLWSTGRSALSTGGACPSCFFSDRRGLLTVWLPRQNRDGLWLLTFREGGPLRSCGRFGKSRIESSESVEVLFFAARRHTPDNGHPQQLDVLVLVAARFAGPDPHGRLGIYTRRKIGCRFPCFFFFFSVSLLFVMRWFDGGGGRGAGCVERFGEGCSSPGTSLIMI